uniref:Reverse transcriptase domain-containing protein n=1 Tax=Tanacetum cinerariifolium TaxID=118510 RepID=A0A6L2KXF5_TANCI|nr:reverse transcriptase domain-containing protein [Tanacetum cinerariifolium]
MTRVPRSIAEHRLNVREGCPPVQQKKRGQAPERTKAIQTEVEKLVEAGIMREDCYPLPEIDWKVESLCGYPFKCFLDAYKGYHQIQMAAADEEKTAFHTGQGVYCYTKMPFGLKNAGATYQRLMDKAFENQMGRNIEAYVDDLVIKSHTETEMVRDIAETFQTLRKINMKLNPKKCSFGKEYSSEAEQAFQQLKQHLSALPLLAAPKPQEELIMYLSATHGAISAVLLTEQGTAQTPVYFISRALQGRPELNYSPLEKLVLSLVFAAKRLRRYFQAHPIAVITDQPIKQVMSRPDAAGRLQKWSIMLGEHNITYRPRTSIKGQILADFLNEIPSNASQDDEKVKDETCLVAHASSEMCLGVDFEPDEWIKDIGCSKHMTGNQKLFSSYKAYNGERRDEMKKMRLDHLKQDQEMLVIKIFSERKKVSRERKKCEKIRAKRSDFLQGMKQYLYTENPNVVIGTPHIHSSIKVDILVARFLRIWIVPKQKTSYAKLKKENRFWQSKIKMWNKLRSKETLSESFAYGTRSKLRILLKRGVRARALQQA